MTKTREIKSSKHLVYSCKYPVVWCTKYRRKVLDSEIEIRLKEILMQVCADCEAEILGVETMPDHVHLLVSCNPTFGIKRLVGVLKGRSSKLLRQEFPVSAANKWSKLTDLYRQRRFALVVHKSIISP